MLAPHDEALHRAAGDEEGIAGAVPWIDVEIRRAATEVRKRLPRPRLLWRKIVDVKTIIPLVALS